MNDKCIKCGYQPGKLFAKPEGKPETSFGYSYSKIISTYACGEFMYKHCDKACFQNIKHEHLHITCPRCGYKWTEPCLDAKKEGIK